MEGRISYFLALFLGVAVVALLVPMNGRLSDVQTTPIIAWIIAPAIVVGMATSSIVVERKRGQDMLDELELVLSEVHRELQAETRH